MGEVDQPPVTDPGSSNDIRNMVRKPRTFRENSGSALISVALPDGARDRQVRALVRPVETVSHA